MAFQLKSPGFLFKSKVETVDSVSTILLYGDSKGLITLSQLKVSEDSVDSQPISTSQPTKKKIERIRILRITKHVAVLANGHILMLNPMTLDVNADLLGSATTLEVSQSDCIAIASGKKIMLFAFKAEINGFVPKSLGKAAEVTVPEQVQRMSIN